MRYFKPFICGCAGGAAGALFASVTKLGASGTGVTGLFGVLLCLSMPVQYILMMVISIGVSFTLTWMFGYKDEEQKQEQKTEQDRSASGISTDAAQSAQDAEKAIYAPISGTVIPREQIPDETFASGVLGDGVGIEPEKGEVTAPFDGEISSPCRGGYGKNERRWIYVVRAGRRESPCGTEINDFRYGKDPRCRIQHNFCRAADQQ